MINCNKCGKNIRKPTKKLENAFFSIAVYKCRKCGVTYKDAQYQTKI